MSLMCCILHFVFQLFSRLRLKLEFLPTGLQYAVGTSRSSTKWWTVTQLEKAEIVLGVFLPQVLGRFKRFRLGFCILVDIVGKLIER